MKKFILVQIFIVFVGAYYINETRKLSHETFYAEDMTYYYQKSAEHIKNYRNELRINVEVMPNQTMCEAIKEAYDKLPASGGTLVIPWAIYPCVKPV